MKTVLAGCGTRPGEAAKPVVAVKVARITAPVRELRARMGEEVAAGQVLAMLESRDLAEKHQEAVAAVTDAWVTVERLRSGTLPGDAERARGQVATAEAALGQTQKIYERRKELLKSETDFAKAKTDYEVAKKSLDPIRNQSGERDIQISQSKVEQGEARLATSKAQLDFAETRSQFAGTVRLGQRCEYEMGAAGRVTVVSKAVDAG